MYFRVLQSCLNLGVTHMLCWGWGNTNWIIIKQPRLMPHFQKKPFAFHPILRAHEPCGTWVGIFGTLGRDSPSRSEEPETRLHHPELWKDAGVLLCGQG